MTASTAFPPEASKVTVRALSLPAMVQRSASPWGALAVAFTRTVTWVPAGRFSRVAGPCVQFVPPSVLYSILSVMPLTDLSLIHI